MINILKDKDLSLTKEEVYLFITTYLEDQIFTLRRQSMSDENFSKSGWSERQAANLGEQKAFTKVLNLIPDQGKHD